MIMRLGSKWCISAGNCKAGQQTNEQMLLAIVKQGSEWCISASNREVGQQMAYQCRAANGVSVQASVMQGQQTNEQAVCLCTRLASSGVQQGNGNGLPYEQQRWAKIEKTSWPGPNMKETVEASHICLAMWRTMASSGGPERATVQTL
ncbi:hypothetical protein C8R44DRAFT_744997 [Mycena epipterygia]|nr:hypothetical protein C8R44DRAFT_744997 [Mycena epipterygia]